jgi:hypothetical protein
MREELAAVRTRPASIAPTRAKNKRRSASGAGRLRGRRCGLELRDERAAVVQEREEPLDHRVCLRGPLVTGVRPHAAESTRSATTPGASPAMLGCRPMPSPGAPRDRRAPLSGLPRASARGATMKSILIADGNERVAVPVADLEVALEQGDQRKVAGALAVGDGQGL